MKLEGKRFAWRRILNAVFLFPSTPTLFSPQNQDLTHFQIFKMQPWCGLMLCESGRRSTLMAQDNSSGHHLDAGADSDIRWAAGENNTRQGAGMLILSVCVCVGVGGECWPPSRGRAVRTNRTSQCCRRGHMTQCNHNPDADGRRRPATGKIVAQQLHKIDVRTFFFCLSETVFPGLQRGDVTEIWNEAALTCTHLARKRKKVMTQI